MQIRIDPRARVREVASLHPLEADTGPPVPQPPSPRVGRYSSQRPNS